MILVVLNGGHTYTANIWKQERFLILASGNASPILIWTNLHGSANAPIAKYALNTSGEVYIDMTDYIRAFPDVATIYVYDVSSTVSSVTVSIKGLIDPSNVYIPYFPYKGDYNRQIVPPSKMISPFGITEFWGDTSKTWLLASSGPTVTIDATYISAHALPLASISGISSSSYYKIYPSGSASKYTITNVEKMQCDKQYAVVTWKSFTGVERVHVFEVVKNKTSNDGNYSLMSILGDYAEIKGREESLTLRIDGLNAYDLWYYADVINSSEVYVDIFHDIPGPPVSAYKNHRSQVTTKSVTYPDGNAGTDGVLEINVNYARFDAL